MEADPARHFSPARPLDRQTNEKGAKRIDDGQTNEILSNSSVRLENTQGERARAHGVVVVGIDDEQTNAIDLILSNSSVRLEHRSEASERRRTVWLL